MYKYINIYLYSYIVVILAYLHTYILSGKYYCVMKPNKSSRHIY